VAKAAQELPICLGGRLDALDSGMEVGLESKVVDDGSYSCWVVLWIPEDLGALG